MSVQATVFLGECRPSLSDRPVKVELEWVKAVHPEDWPPLTPELIAGLWPEFIERTAGWTHGEPTEADRLWAWTVYHQGLAELPYDLYLATEWWLGVREHVRSRAGHRCQTCRAADHLHAHHNTYAHRGWEWPEDLILLCAECHARIHGKEAH